MLLIKKKKKIHIDQWERTDLRYKSKALALWAINFHDPDNHDSPRARHPGM